jgi:hypothetical protein
MREERGVTFTRGRV